MCEHDCPASTPKPINIWWHDVQCGFNCLGCSSLVIFAWYECTLSLFLCSGPLESSLLVQIVIKRKKKMNGPVKLAFLLGIGVSIWNVNKIQLAEMWSWTEFYGEKRFLGKNCMLRVVNMVNMWWTVRMTNNVSQKGYYRVCCFQDEESCIGKMGTDK